MNRELSNAEQYINWLKTKAQLNARSEKAAARFVRRGQVYWCQFGINVGSEMSKTTPRPAVIVQNQNANRTSSNTIVVPITHNSKQLPCLVPLEPITDDTGTVILDGQVNTSNLICVSKARLGDLITTLSASKMREIDKSLAASLELEKYYEAEREKYEKLMTYTEQVKNDRNKAQDRLEEIRTLISEHGFDEISREKLMKMLDISPSIP